MKRIEVTIVGVSPLLLNRFTDAAQQAASGGTRAATVGEKGTPMEQAETKLYTHQDNGSAKLIMPQPNIFATIIEAGKYFKVGKSKVTTLKTSMIPSCVFFDVAYFPLVSKEGWTVDTRPVRIPSTGGRILCHRPLFNDWSVKFEMELDDEIMTEGLLREIVDAAGKRVGLCDYRPACKGPFGRFRVDKWLVKK